MISLEALAKFIAIVAVSLTLITSLLGTILALIGGSPAEYKIRPWPVLLTTVTALIYILMH